MPRRSRLDTELVRRGLARSREHAGQLVTSGRVSVGGSVATKSATVVALDAAITVREPHAREYVSRGGHKLSGALDVFSDHGLEVAGRRCLDAGASTGGFSDVLLRRGAATVVAVDVGYGQLAWRLRNDPRVAVHERTNVRGLRPESVGGPVDLVVADLSFISLRLVLAELTDLCREDGDLVLLVKPQFEVGRQLLGRNGVVRDPEQRVAAVLAVTAAAAALGWGTAAAVASSLPGPAGNVEYFVWLRRGGAPLPLEEAAAVIAAGPVG